MRPTLLTRSPGGNQSSNLQVVKTMLSQSGGKPGQTTIVLAQPGGQQVTVGGVEQLTQVLKLVVRTYHVETYGC